MKQRVRTPNTKLIQISGTVVVLLVMTGLADGRFADTKGRQQKLMHTSELLASLPLECGNWTSTSIEVDSEELRIAEATGAVLRCYRNRLSGDLVTVLLLCGPPGPISVHPPTACYKARGYRLVDEPRRVTFVDDNKSHEVLAAEFSNPAGFAEDRVGITWCWTADGHWTTPQNPRFEFADEAALLKLYITWDRGGDSRSLEASIPKEFFHSFKDSCKGHMYRRESSLDAITLQSSDS